MDIQAQKLRRELLNTGVQVKEINGQIYLIMPGNITFDSNDANIKVSFQPVLNSIAKVIKDALKYFNKLTCSPRFKFLTYAIIAKVAIFTVAGFMVLSQLGIAAEIVNTAFKLILAAVAIAVALAFGLGGKEFAAKTLEKLDDLKADEEEKTEE